MQVNEYIFLNVWYNSFILYNILAGLSTYVNGDLNPDEI